MDQHRSRKQRSDLQGVRVDSFLHDEAGLQILAYLQRTLMYSMPLEYFESDVIYYYEKHLQRLISASQIKEKLLFFWCRWHALGDKPSDWKKIYHLGLEGLPRLEKEWKDWVMERAVMLKDGQEGTPRRLRNASARSRILLSPAKRPSTSRVGTPSRGVRKSRKLSESPTQRKARTKISMAVVSYQQYFFRIVLLTSKLHTECSKNLKFPNLRTSVINKYTQRALSAPLR
jgi:hypothetical protein